MYLVCIFLVSQSARGNLPNMPKCVVNRNRPIYRTGPHVGEGGGGHCATGLFIE